MIKSLLASLNVKPEEQVQVVMMLATGFFMGIFIATYTVAAESLFLNELSGQLNKAFLFSGITGIASTILFSFFQNKVKFSNLTLSAIILIVFLVSLIYVLLHYGDPSYRPFVLFAMYGITGPVTAILLLCYWGIFGRLFNFKQSKRIIGWIDTGQLLAAIIAFFLIPLTSAYFPDTENYLIVCNLAILGASVFMFIISTRFPLTKNDPSEFDVSVRKETRLVRILSDRYTLLLSLFLIISMTTYVFSQYSFQNLINVQYPEQRGLTNFLAYFNGAIYALSLVMQTFVNDKILGNYGIRISLFILPAVVGVFALLSFGVGLFVGYDPQLTPDTFIFFFLAVALLRLFNAMFKDSLENPIFKLLFIPLDSRYRFGIQSKVEGIVNESGRFLAGVLIFCFAMMPFFKAFFIPAFIAALAAAYFFVVRHLHNGYRNKIRSKLESTELQSDRLELGFTQITQRLESRLIGQDASKAVFSLKLLEKISPSQLATWVNKMINSGEAEARDYAQRRLNELKGLSVSERYVIRIDQKNAESKAERNVLSKSDLELIINSGGDITKSRIQKLSRSPVAEDRQYAGELLLHTSGVESISFLIELLGDIEPKVRNTAIKTATKKYNNEVLLALIENLNNPLYSNQAQNALTVIGPKALLALDGAFYRSGQSTATMLKIVQILGRIGGQRAKELLWNKIDYPDKVIVSQVLLALGEAGFKAGITQVTRIKYAIESDIADINWNLAAIQEIADEGNSAEVKKALRRELQNDIQHIYMLLAMLYDTRSIQLVKENIESGTTEGTTYAVELLDVFLSEQLKQRVIPVLDDMTDAEKLSRLEVFYPRVKLDSKLVLKFLINRDFTQSNRWTKATVIHQIGTLRIKEFMLDLIAQLFNPDKLVREVAAWALFQIDPARYETNTARLGSEVKSQLDATVLMAGDGARLMIFEKILFFKSIELFAGVSGLTLSFLADLSEELHLKQGETLVVDEKLTSNFYLVYNGILEYYSAGQHHENFARGQFVGEMLSVAGFAHSNLLVAKETAVVLKINKDLFYELLADNVKLADKVLEYV
jgi:hypothetical protein